MTALLPAVALFALLALTACDGESTARGVSDEHAAKDIEMLDVFAAASTAELMTAIADRYTEKTGRPVRLNIAASSTLARQIEAGARVDVFLSAHPMWMDFLEERGLIAAESRCNLLGNTLVLVAPRDALFDAQLDSPPPVGRLAIGDPDHVPAGIYARQACTNLGWWDDLRDRIVPTVDVRATVRLVEMGEVDAALVYASDAHVSTRVSVVLAIPREFHDPIRYPIAATRDASPGALEFVAYVTAESNVDILTSFGFEQANE